MKEVGGSIIRGRTGWVKKGWSEKREEMQKREVREGPRGGGGGNAEGVPRPQARALTERTRNRKAVEEGMGRREVPGGGVTGTLQVCLSHRRAQIV
jgi:hypothetical protein